MILCSILLDDILLNKTETRGGSSLNKREMLNHLETLSHHRDWEEALDFLSVEVVIWNLRRAFWGWRDGSVVKTACFSCVSQRTQGKEKQGIATWAARCSWAYLDFITHFPLLVSFPRVLRKGKETIMGYNCLPKTLLHPPSFYRDLPPSTVVLPPSTSRHH